METENSINFKNFDNQSMNNISQNFSRLPEAKKPNFTIQDSYLQFYFGGVGSLRKNQPISEKSNLELDNKNLKNEHVDLKNKMNTYLETMTQKEEIESSLSEITNNQKSEYFNKDEKFMNKKHHRQKKEIDPLDLTTFRLKGQFIKSERGPPVEETNKNIQVNKPEVPIPQRKIVHEKIEIQNDKKQNLEGNVISRSAQIFGRLDMVNNNFSQSQSEQTNLEDDELIPLAIRNKLKNKK
jgi:hypothetical protein